MKRALIHGQRVAQVLEAGQEFEVAAPLTWVDCPDATVADAWRYENGVFVPPPPAPPPATDEEVLASRFDTERMLKACMMTTLAAINDLRTDPLTVKPAITPGAWRQRILDAYKALTGALLVVLLAAGSVAAQAPAPASPAGLSCEDQVRETRVNLQITTLGQIRERAEAAREIAQLMKQVDALRAEAAAVKAALEALKKPATPAPAAPR